MCSDKVKLKGSLQDFIRAKIKRAVVMVNKQTNQKKKKKKKRRKKKKKEKEKEEKKKKHLPHKKPKRSTMPRTQLARKTSLSPFVQEVLLLSSSMKTPWLESSNFQMNQV